MNSNNKKKTNEAPSIRVMGLIIGGIVWLGMTALGFLLFDVDPVRCFAYVIAGPLVGLLIMVLLGGFAQLLDDVRAIREKTDKMLFADITLSDDTTTAIRQTNTPVEKQNSNLDFRTVSQPNDILKNAAAKVIQNAVKRCPHCGDIVKADRCEMCGKEVK